MKKVTFKGTINGETFDNVESYNKKISSLLESDENIEASSNTYICNDCSTKENCNCDAVANESEQSNIDLEKFTPLFDSNTKQYYLDAMVTDDAELNAKRLSGLEDIFGQRYTELYDLLRNRKLSVDQAIELSQVIKNIRLGVNSDQQDNNDKIEEIKKELNRKSAQLDILEKATPFIESTKEYYDNIWNDLKIYLLS